MKRRNALIGSAVLAGITADKVFAADTSKSDKRFGDIVIPPEEEMGKEKHVPIIDAPTVEHHIKWIQLYAREEDTRYAVQLGSFEFFPTYTQPKVTVPVMLNKNATLYAIEHCNIHGLWDYSVDVKVE